MPTKDLKAWRDTSTAMHTEIPRGICPQGSYLQTFLRPTSPRSIIFNNANKLIEARHDGDKIELTALNNGRFPQIRTQATTLSGHMNMVTTVAFNRDGTRLASGSADKTVLIWDLIKSQPLATLRGHTDHITAITFSHNNTILASGSRDNAVMIWNLATGICLQTLRIYTYVISSLAFSHDSKWLVSGSYDGTMQLWNPKTGKCLRKLYQDKEDCINSVAFSHNSKRLAFGFHSGTIRICDPETGTLLQTFTDHTKSVAAVVFNHDSSKLASGSYDKTVRLWDPEMGTSLQTLASHTRPVTSIAFNHDSSKLASGALDETVQLWYLPRYVESAIFANAMPPKVKTNLNANHTKISNETRLRYGVMMALREIIDSFKMSLAHDSDKIVQGQTIPKLINRITQLPSEINSDMYLALNAALSKSLPPPKKTPEEDTLTPSIKTSIHFFVHTISTLQDKESLKFIQQKVKTAAHQFIMGLHAHYKEKETTYQCRRNVKVVAGIGITLLALMATNWTSDTENITGST